MAAIHPSSLTRLDLVLSLSSARTWAFSLLGKQDNQSCSRGQMLSPSGARALAKGIQKTVTSLWHVPWPAPESQVSRVPLGPAGALSAWSSFHTCARGPISPVPEQTHGLEE